MSRLRVLHLGSPTGLYGAERWILALLAHLPPERIESHVGVIRDDVKLDAPLCGEAAKRGFPTRIFEAPGRINFSAVSQIRRYLREREIQVLHTHGYKTDIVGLLASRGVQTRLVTTPHGWSTQAGFMLSLYESIDRAVFPFFDAVAPLSEALFKSLRRIPGVVRRLHMIPNAVDVAEIDSVTEIAREVAAWRSSGNFVFGYIGQLITRKGIEVLLEAFTQLRVPGKKLALVGEGPQRAELEALAHRLGIADDVQFFGFRPDRTAFLKGFDVFVLPSRLEGIPRCLMESLAAGVPSIASDIPGCRDLIDHGRTGLLFPLDDVAALRESMERTREPALRAELSRNGRALVLSRHSAAVMARQYESLYASLAHVR